MNVVHVSHIVTTSTKARRLVQAKSQWMENTLDLFISCNNIQWCWNLFLYVLISIVKHERDVSASRLSHNKLDFTFNPKQKKVILSFFFFSQQYTRNNFIRKEFSFYCFLESNLQKCSSRCAIKPF